MAEAIDLNIYSDVLVVLGTAGIVIPIVRRLGISPVLGYLAAGAVLGPRGLGSFKTAVPALRWITIVDAKDIEGIAELGVVFLLFLIGLELSFGRLRTMRRWILGLGSLQVVCSTALIAAAAVGLGVAGDKALIIGSCLSLSSTAIVVEVLSDQGRLGTRAGRASFSVLLAQDIAVIPLLLFIAAAGGGAGRSLSLVLESALLQAVVAVAFIVILGRILMRPLFHLVASVHSSDLFVAAVLFVIIGAGILADVAGLSMALGAFVAGLLLAETEFDKAIEGTVAPFKGLLLGIFFFTVGMSADIRIVLQQPVFLLACVAGLILVKGGVLALLGRIFRLPWASAVEMALLLGPGGEFAFVGVTQATALGLLNRAQSDFVLVLTVVTMALIPLLSSAANRLRPAFEAKNTNPKLAALPTGADCRAIVIGFGRVGSVVCELLQQHGISFVAIDRNPQTVTEARRRLSAVYYGNAVEPDFLRACGIDRAAGVVLTLNDTQVLDDIVRVVRRLRPDIPIIARARDADHARHLYLAGVTDAVPETIEASLHLSEAALVSLGVAMGPAIATVHEKRDEFRRQLQRAATEAEIAVSETGFMRAR